MKSNKIIDYLIKTNRLPKPKGLPHFGGRQYVYSSGKEKFEGNIDCKKLGELLTYMTDEEIETIYQFTK